MNLTSDQIIALAQILMPVVEKGAIEVARLIVTMNADITAEQLADELEKSKSRNWPELNFGQ